MKEKPSHGLLPPFLGFAIALILFLIIKKVIFPIESSNLILVLEGLAIPLALSPIILREVDHIRKLIVGKSADHGSINLREIILIYITVGASILFWWGSTILLKTSTAIQ